MDEMVRSPTGHLYDVSTLAAAHSAYAEDDDKVARLTYHTTFLLSITCFGWALLRRLPLVGLADPYLVDVLFCGMLLVASRVEVIQL